MPTKIILPILNHPTITYKGPTWYLSDNISIETIDGEDFGLIFSYKKSEYLSFLKAESKCIRIENIDPKNSEEIAKNESSKISFLFNYFKDNDPLALSFAVQITKRRKQKLDKIFDLPVISETRFRTKNPYRIKKGIKREIITSFFRVIDDVHKNQEGLILTLSRFNSALFRKDPYDKIIDITISLESLISGTSELRYKFSLYNALVSEDENELREEAFLTLQLLYDARSTIVHGARISQSTFNKKIQPILDNWEKVVGIAEKVLGYYLLYMNDHEIDQWHKHQKNIALGIENRISY